MSTVGCHFGDVTETSDQWSKYDKLIPSRSNRNDKTMINIVRKVNPVVMYVGITLFFLVWFIWRIFFKSLYGVLVLAVLCYMYSESLFGVAPLSFQQLVMLFDSLQPEFKVGVVSSLITVIGFMFAFHVAIESWRRQMREELKLKAANEMQGYFERVVYFSSVLGAYAENVRLLKTAYDNNSVPHMKLQIEILQGQSIAFLEARNEMQRFSSDVYNLLARHENVLSQAFGLKKTASFAVSQIHKIAQSMWILLPVVDTSHEGWMVSFLEQVDFDGCEQLALATAKVDMHISGAVAGINGYMYARIWELSPAKIFEWLSSPKGHISALKDFQKED